jgi:hypothetical protein
VTLPSPRERSVPVGDLSVTDQSRGLSPVPAARCHSHAIAHGAAIGAAAIGLATTGGEVATQIASASG